MGIYTLRTHTCHRQSVPCSCAPSMCCSAHPSQASVSSSWIARTLRRRAHALHRRIPCTIKRIAQQFCRLHSLDSSIQIPILCAIVGCTNLLNCVEKTHWYYDDKNTLHVRSARLQQRKKLLLIFPIDVKKITECFCLQRLRELMIENGTNSSPKLPGW